MQKKATYEELEQRIQELENSVEKLQDEVAWRRLLVNESRDGIVVLDEDGKVFEANQEYADMLGYSLEEVYQLNIWEWNTDIPKERLLEMLLEVDASGNQLETHHQCKNGSSIDVEISANGATYRDRKLIFCICRDITEKNQAKKEKEQLIQKLQEALAEVKTLQKILPLCSYCNKVRDDKGYWEQVEVYLAKTSNSDISRSICPECAKKYYPEQYRNMYPDFRHKKT